MIPQHFESNIFMKTYEEILEAISNGASYKINLEERTLVVNRKQIDIASGETMSVEGVLEKIEELYSYYKHSIPSATEPSRPYFKALKYNELSQEDQTYGPNRDVARFELEYFVLQSIINGSFVWNEETMGKWFWRSSNDYDLVILRSWIETSNV